MASLKAAARAWVGATLLPAAPLAQTRDADLDPWSGGEHVQLFVGQRARLCPGGNCRSPICDEPEVATVTADGSGVLEARKAGVTICSVDYGLGQRRVIQVEVMPRSRGAPPAAGPSPPPRRPLAGPARQESTAPPEGAAPRPDEEAIYRWAGEDGSIHFGHIDDLPAARRAQARRVTSDVTVVPAEGPTGSPPARSPAPAPAIGEVRAGSTGAEPQPPPQIELPPPDAGRADGGVETWDASEVTCWTGPGGRLTCAPYGRERAGTPAVGPRLPKAGTPRPVQPGR